MTNVIKMDGEDRISLSMDDAATRQAKLTQALEGALYKTWEDNPMSTNMVIGVLECLKMRVYLDE